MVILFNFVLAGSASALISTIETILYTNDLGAGDISLLFAESENCFAFNALLVCRSEKVGLSVCSLDKPEVARLHIFYFNSGSIRPLGLGSLAEYCGR